MLEKIMVLSVFASLLCGMLALLRLIIPSGDTDRAERQFTFLITAAVLGVILGILMAIAIVIKGIT